MNRLSDIALLERLVAFDTTSRRSNLELARFVSDYLDRPGVTIERNLSPDGDKTNLVVWAGPDAGAGSGSDREGLVLSGHMDVVPALESGWQSDPFRLTEREGVLVARGSSDMKGFLAVAVNAFARVDPGALRHPLVLLLTYDEEVGTLGAKRFVETWPANRPLPRRTVIGEPTSLKVVRLHKGHLSFRVRFEGKAAHSGFPALGVNALEPLARGVLALTELGRSLRAERPAHSDCFPGVPFAPLNVATVHGGDAVNVVPASGEITLGVRHLPGMEREELEQRVRRALEQGLNGAPFELELLCESPPMMAPAGGEFHRALERVTGCAEGEGASFATDAGWFQRAGHECVLLGPGSIEVAHRANEFVPKADLVHAAEMVARLVQLYCAR